MEKSFLFSSGFLFLGGALLAIFSSFSYSDFFFLLSAVLMLMGGIPILAIWCKHLFRLLPDAFRAGEGDGDSQERAD